MEAGPAIVLVGGGALLLGGIYFMRQNAAAAAVAAGAKPPTTTADKVVSTAKSALKSLIALNKERLKLPLTGARYISEEATKVVAQAGTYAKQGVVTSVAAFKTVATAPATIVKGSVKGIGSGAKSVVGAVTSIF